MTHCERVLALLSDGREHSHHELYALNVVAHSRVADLRRKGYEITHRREGDTSVYQLVSSPEQTPQAQEPSVLGALSSSEQTGAAAAAPRAKDRRGHAATSKASCPLARAQRGPPLRGEGQPLGAAAGAIRVERSEREVRANRKHGAGYTRTMRKGRGETA